jgi:hypothetical protein
MGACGAPMSEHAYSSGRLNLDIPASRAALEALPWGEGRGGDHETGRHARPG